MTVSSVSAGACNCGQRPLQLQTPHISIGGKHKITCHRMVQEETNSDTTEWSETTYATHSGPSTAFVGDLCFLTSTRGVPLWRLFSSSLAKFLNMPLTPTSSCLRLASFSLPILRMRDTLLSFFPH